MLRTIIIDDEVSVYLLLSELHSEFPLLEIIARTPSAREGLDLVKEYTPDVVFLNTELEGVDIFNLLEKLKEESCLVIMVSDTDKFAVQAFDYRVYDYILKPLEKERLKKTLSGLQKEISDEPAKEKVITSNGTHIPDFRRRKVIPVKVTGSIHLVETSSIKYILASGYYIEIYLQDRKLLVRNALKNILDRLDPQKFMRIHRSSLINLDFLETINSIGPGEAEAVMKDGKVLRISRSRKEKLFEKVGL